jgi:hypothetical protein
VAGVDVSAVDGKQTELVAVFEQSVGKIRPRQPIRFPQLNFICKVFSQVLILLSLVITAFRNLLHDVTGLILKQCNLVIS